MKALLLLIVFFFAPSNGLTFVHFNATLERPPLPLTVGERRLLRFPHPIHRFSLDAHCARSLRPPTDTSQPAEHQLLIEATHAGNCHLQVWFKSNRSEHRTLLVQTPAAARTTPFAALWIALSQLQEAEAFLAGKTWVLQGVIHQPDEARKLAQIAADSPNEIRDQTTLSSDLLSQFQKSLENWIQENHFTFHVENVGQSLRLSGNITDPTTRAEIERQARAIAPKLDIQLQMLPTQDPVIYFKVTLLEISQQDAHALGIDWPAQSLPLANYNPQTGIQSLLEINLALKMMSQNGKARILSRPEIALKVPGEAEFFSGGEFPVAVPSRFKDQAHISWKQYGLMMKLKTLFASDTQVRLEINSESSQIHAEIATQFNIPALKVHRMKTQVDATFERPLFLSGLFQNQQLAQDTGIPYLNRIPFFGKLFGTHSESERQTEIIAILIPQKSATPPQALLDQIQEPTP